MPASSQIAQTLLTHREELLQEWIKEQLSSENLRADLLSEGELRAQSERFISLLARAVQSGVGNDIHRPEFQQVMDMLDELSRTRSRQGFSPSETATFVFSLKQPLFDILRRLHASDAAGLADDTWSASVLLDKLGLHTTEIYQQSREEVIRRQQE